MTEVLDALERTERILRDAIKVELSPASWYVISAEPYLPEFGPIWEGFPGSHPLLPFIRNAIQIIKHGNQ